MSKTNYPGINYAGPGSKTNMDAETGIRYGVISQNSVHPESVDDIYHGPHSRDLAWEAAIEEAKHKLMQCLDQDTEEERKNALLKFLGEFISDRWLSDRMTDILELNEDARFINRDEAWSVVEQDFNDNIGDHECDPLYEHDGYKITKCLQNDLFILKSPFYTYAQFCSPCVPGACNLDSPLDHIPDDGSNGCYCLGHEWFEEGVAPYPVFNMGGAEIFPETKS